MLSPQLFLRTLRQGACGLWSLHVAALDADRSAVAYQARIAVCRVAYDHDLDIDDIALAFAFTQAKRDGYYRPLVERRHVEMLADSLAYTANYDRLADHARDLVVGRVAPAGRVRA